MPLPIARGEIANRLRRFFDIRGRIPSQLDETVVPVATLQNVDAPPWRFSPIIFADWNTSPAVAAENSFLCVGLPASQMGVFIVDRVICDNLSGATGANVSLVLHSYAAMLATGSLQFPQCRKYEQLDPADIIANNAQPSGVHLILGADASVLLGAEIERSRFAATATGLTRIEFKGPYVIPAGGAVCVWRLTQNEALNAHFYGRYFPDVPSSGQLS